MIELLLFFFANCSQTIVTWITAFDQTAERKKKLNKITDTKEKQNHRNSAERETRFQAKNQNEILYFIFILYRRGRGRRRHQ